MNSDRKMPIDEFYYILSMKWAQEVQIIDGDVLSIWDEGRWIMAKLL